MKKEQPNVASLEPNVASSEYNVASLKPRFKVGDKVRVIEEGLYKGFITEVIGIAESNQDCPYQIDSYRAFEEGRWFSDSDLEPYTEESRNLSQNIANCDKPTDKQLNDNMEETELNLCEILQGCEGEKIFLPDEGECEIVSVAENEIKLSQEPNRTIILNEDSFIFTPTGFAYAYPSEKSFLANPLNACKAWQEWKETRKPKPWRAKSSAGVAVSECKEHWEDYTYWYITSEGVVFQDEETNCKADKLRYELGNYFRTPELAAQAAEAVKETFDKFHGQNAKQ